MLANRIEEWERQITDKAMQAGEVRGEQQLISRLLTKKFGTLPIWVNERLLSASPEQLDAYGDKLLEAETLEQVFS